MKTPLLIFLFLFSITASSQITTPALRAFFGVDADLKARIINGTLQSSDDWYVLPGTSGTSTNGTNVIDTTGAAALVAGYATDVSPFPKRSANIYRGMSRPAFTVVNNRLWLDALFVRDYHGNDTTVFTLASKNGQSPVDWTGGIQPVPDKNDILDMFMHIRRAGPNSTDSLWMFGGLSLDNVTGNRYFDFEMYQTDIYYDRTSQKWYGYGPDAGHTSWQFDGAGNILKAGDIIFSAEYQSASLTNIEARIWIDRAALSLAPTAFNWSGQFDGANAGSQYGYASILPKTSGAFYTGLQCGNAEWAGAFSLVLQDNSLSTTYAAKQFMEFSVNLTKLGLDPVTTFGGDVCGTPFNRLVVKTRASESFTASLKDFVAPTDLFLAARADANATVPLFCGNANNVSTLQVLNPAASSIYTWTTPNGNIVDGPVGSSVTADKEGMYIVTQQLMAGCSAYAKDTVYIVYEPDCTPLKGNGIELNISLNKNEPQLKWISKTNSHVLSYQVEKSSDGVRFQTITTIENNNPNAIEASYLYTDTRPGSYGTLYYRVRFISETGGFGYSRITKVQTATNAETSALPNPANQYVTLSIAAANAEKASVAGYSFGGKLVYSGVHSLLQGNNFITINDIYKWPPGVYIFQIKLSNRSHWHKIIIQR